MSEGLKVIYPKVNSKVAENEIIFRWEAEGPSNRPQEFMFELYRCKISGIAGNAGTIVQKLRDSRSWVRVCQIPTHETSHRAAVRGGHLYLCIVKPGYHGIRLPQDVLSNILECLEAVGTRGNRIAAKPIRNRGVFLQPFLTPGFSFFFVKPLKNHLEHYLEDRYKKLKKGIAPLKRRHCTPFIPLVFHQIERYLNADQTTQTPFDIHMERPLRELSEKLGGRDKLEKMIRNYNSISKSKRKEWFGNTAVSLPRDLHDTRWTEATLKSVFTDDRIQALKQEQTAGKKMTLSFKVPALHLVDIPARDKIISLPLQSIMDYRKFFRNGSYFLLKVIPRNGTPEYIAAQGAFHPEQGRIEEYRLTLQNDRLNQIDSAAFRAELWYLPTDGKNKDLHKFLLFKDGTLTVSGGEPILLSLQPRSLVMPHDYDDLTSITFKIRNAGPHGSESGHVSFKHCGQGPAFQTSKGALTLSSQSIDFQEFKFNLQEAGVPRASLFEGTYEVYYTVPKKGPSRDTRSNSLSICIVKPLHKVKFTRLVCLDESDPEWFGDDSICFAANLFTIGADGTIFWKNTVQSDGPIGEYHTGSGKNEKFVVPFSLFHRHIEEFLWLDFTIYEYDDLGWLADLLKILAIAALAIVTVIITAIAPGAGVLAGMIGMAVSIGTDFAWWDEVQEGIDAFAGSLQMERLGSAIYVHAPRPKEDVDKQLPLKGEDSNYTAYINIASE